MANGNYISQGYGGSSSSSSSSSSSTSSSSTSSSGGSAYSDDFSSYNDGDHLSIVSANWTAIINDFIVTESPLYGKVVKVSNINDVRCIDYYNQPISDDQWAYMSYAENSEICWSGVGVRVSGTAGHENGYFLRFSTEGWVQFMKLVDGKYTNIAEHAYYMTIFNGTNLTIEVSGSTIRCYLNGALDTQLNGTGIFTDTDLTTGYPAIYGKGLGQSFIDIFIAGNL
jgi:hypothetical protein